MTFLRPMPGCAIFFLLCAPVAATFTRQAQATQSLSFLQLEAVDVATGRRRRKDVTDTLAKLGLGKDDDDSVDVQDIVDQLGSLNTSLDKINDIVDFVNDTAMDLLVQVATVIDAFQAVLPALQMAVNAMKIVPGSDELANWATKFIDTANKTVDSFDQQIATIPDTVGKALDTVMPQFTALVELIFGQFEDAATQVAALQNATEELRRIGAIPDAGSDQSLAREVAQNVEGTPEQEKHQARKKHNKDIALLMKARALRSDATNTAESMDSAVMAKGATKCSKAKASIQKANSTVSTYAEQIASLNETAFELLEQVLVTASTGLEFLNTTVMDAMQPAQLMIPAAILQPITNGLSALMEIMDQLVDTVNEALPQIQDKVIDAQGPIASIPAIADKLEEEADEACAAAAD